MTLSGGRGMTRQTRRGRRATHASPSDDPRARSVGIRRRMTLGLASALAGAVMLVVAMPGLGTASAGSHPTTTTYPTTTEKPSTTDYPSTTEKPSTSTTEKPSTTTAEKPSTTTTEKPSSTTTVAPHESSTTHERAGSGGATGPTSEVRGGGPTGESPGGTLPRTGASSSGPLAVAGGLLLVGGLLLLATGQLARRRLAG